MDTCPPELHSYICQLACFDDGTTVRALNLVSRYFHEISRPFLYQSISLYSHDQVDELVSKLQVIPPHLRQIRHLYFSDGSRHKNQITNAQIEAKILRVLTLAAPTLETLAFTATCPSTSTSLIGKLFRTSFPRLQELSLSGFYPFLSASGKLPALRRLHLTGNRNPHGLFQLGGLAAACPSLTHLRVSGLSMGVSFCCELENTLNGDQLGVFSSKLPSALRSIVVQPGPSPASIPPRENSLPRLKEQEMMRRLGVLSMRKQQANEIQLTILQRPEMADANFIWSNWLDRLSGGNGCWPIS